MSRRGAPRLIALRGPAAMAAGLGVGGAATVGMFAITSRWLPPEQFAGFATWWLTVNLLAPLIAVFEVYIARTLLARERDGGVDDGAIAQIFGLSLLVIGGFSSIVLVIAWYLADRMFGGSLQPVAAIPLYALVLTVQSLQRGVASGRRRFGFVGLQVALDGFLRVALVSAVVLVSPGSNVFAAPIVAGLASVFLLSPFMRDWIFTPRPFLGNVEVRPIGWLLAASAGPVLIGSAVAPWLAATASTSAFVIGGFSAALTLSRVPTQLASAAFAPALAHMAGAEDAGDHTGLRRIRGKLLRLAFVVGTMFVVGFVIVGEWVIEVYVGPDFAVPEWVMGLLAAASAGLFVATIQQAALTAQRRWSKIAAGWLVGCGAFILTLFLPVDALTRAGSAPLVGVLAASVVMETRGGRRITDSAASTASMQ